MSAGAELKRIFLGSDWGEDVHRRYCAARNWRTALAVVALCALEAALAWRLLRTPFPPLSVPSFLVAIVIILFGASLFPAYRCVRERFVSSQFVLRGLLGLATFRWPAVAARNTAAIREGLLALWLIALLVGVSLLAQALWGRR